ncbi:MAG: hypothetical protein ACXV5Q_02000 [Frankiaceae bacterium]
MSDQLILDDPAGQAADPPEHRRNSFRYAIERDRAAIATFHSRPLTR